MCEEFAPRNGTIRLRGERGANRARKKWPAASGTRRGRGNCVKNLLPQTELQGLAGRGEQTAPGKRRLAPNGARELCEDFAPLDGRTRPSGEGGEQTAPGKRRRPDRRSPPAGTQRASNQKGVDSAAARNPLPSSPTFSLPPAFSPSVPRSNPNPSADASSQSDPPARPSWNPGF